MTVATDLTNSFLERFTSSSSENQRLLSGWNGRQIHRGKIMINTNVNTGKNNYQRNFDIKQTDGFSGVLGRTDEWRGAAGTYRSRSAFGSGGVGGVWWL